jgi:hypothetical protein
MRNKERNQEIIFYTTDRTELIFVFVYSVVIIFTVEGNLIYSCVFDLWKIIVTLRSLRKFHWTTKFNFFLAHEEKYLILIELLNLNSNV